MLKHITRYRYEPFGMVRIYSFYSSDASLIPEVRFDTGILMLSFWGYLVNATYRHSSESFPEFKLTNYH